MQPRPVQSLDRTFAPPTRAQRPSVITAIGELPVPQAIMLIIFACAAIQIGGAATILAQIGLSGLLAFYMAAYRPREFLGLFKWWPLLILPALATFSTVWSVAPAVSLRYGIQLMITCAIGILLARAASPRAYVAMLYVATAIVCVASLFSGRYGPSQAGSVLIGLTGSKNEMAYLAQLLLTSSMAVMIDRGQPAGLRLSTIFFFLFACVIIALGQAAGAMLTAVGGAGVLFSLFMLHLFKLRGRLVIILALLVMIPPVYAARDEIKKQTEVFMQDVLKKDSTLTGRTWLWARADELIKERPIIGHGYRAIMVGETIEGQGILRWADQRDGRAFHFHSTYRELGVDLGFVGMGIFIFMMVTGLLALIRRVVLNPTPAYSFFLVSYLVILARTPAEVVVGQFLISASMLFSLWVWAFAKPSADSQWLGRQFHADGRPLYHKGERRTAADPIRLAAPVRPRR